MKSYSLQAAFKYAFFIFFLLTIVSCTGTKDILYIQDNSEKKYNYSDTINQNISHNDILSIKINSSNFDASKFYNFSFGNQVINFQDIEILKINSYLVNKNGNISLPLLGEIYVLDKSIEELENFILAILKNEGHLIDPQVDIRLINSKFTILGEVKLPGTYSFSENNLSLFQALGMAGDLTIYGRRDDLTLIRETNGVKNIIKIDLTSSDWIGSDKYFIKKNDVIIINPNKAKIKSAGIIGNASTIISLFSLLLTSIILFNK